MNHRTPQNDSHQGDAMTILDLASDHRAAVATVGHVAALWAQRPPAAAREAVAVRPDGALVLVRMSSRGVSVRRKARAADLAQVWAA